MTQDENLASGNAWYHACKYPAMDTLLSPSCKFGVFAGQFKFIRFTRIVDNAANFVLEVANLILVLGLMRLGHSQKQLMAKCKAMHASRSPLAVLHAHGTTKVTTQRNCKFITRHDQAAGETI